MRAENRDQSERTVFKAPVTAFVAGGRSRDKIQYMEEETEMKKKLAAVLTAAAVTAGLLAGCSGDLSNEYVTVKQYKGLEVPQTESQEITDDYVEQVIQSNLSATMTKTDITDRAAQTGDWVNIDYTGYINDETFDGGSDEGADLELGSGTFIGATDEYAGFEDQIVGHNTGDEFDITVQFPDDYQDTSKAGVVARFHIVLNEIYSQNIPELTDEWVAENSQDSTTVDEYREEVKERLEESSEQSARTELENGVQQALLDQSEMKKYPDGAVDEQIEQANNYYTMIASMYGIELSDFITGYLQMTEDDFNTQVEKLAKESVQLDEAMKLIAEKEKLEPTDEEYEEAIKGYAEEAGADDIDAFKEQYGEDSLKDSALRQAVLDYLVDNCVQVEDSESN